MDSTNLESVSESVNHVRRFKIPSSMVGFFMSILIIILLVALGYAADKNIVQRLDTQYLDEIVNASWNYRINPRYISHFDVNSVQLNNQTLLICNHIFVEDGPQFYICHLPNEKVLSSRAILVNETSHISRYEWNSLQNSKLFTNRFIYR